jgi:hypothetical protein
MYYGQMVNLERSLSYKQGLHPLTFVRLCTISSGSPKCILVQPVHGQEDVTTNKTIIICYLYVLWRDAKLGV